MKIDRAYLESVLQDALGGHPPKISWSEFKQKAFGIKKKSVNAELAGKRAEQLRQTLIVGIGAAILAAIVFLIILPRMVTIFQYRQQLKDHQEMQEELQEKLTALNRAHNNYENLTADIETIDQAVGDYSDISTVLLMIEKVAGEAFENGHKFVLNSVSVNGYPEDYPDTAAQNSGLLSEQELNLTVSCRGEDAGIHDLINRLKALRHNFHFNQLNFTADPNKPDQVQLEMDISYYYFN